MTSTRCYLVVAEYQRPTGNIAAGATAYVLYVAAATLTVTLTVVVRDRSGQILVRAETIDMLASFRIRPVLEKSCPRAAWRWAQPTPERCEELLSRCKELRVRTRNPSSNDGD